MEESYVPSDLSINSADAEVLEINFNSEGLELKYLDWNYRKNIVKFDFVLAFKFEYFGNINHRNDKVYEVKNSRYLEEQLKLYRINYSNDEIEQFKHIRICFNSDDEWLEVITDGNITIEQE